MQILESAFNDGISEKMINEFVGQYKPAFPVGWNSRMEVWSFVKHSILSQKPLYVPHMVFIDRGGVIRAEYRGEDGFFQNGPANIRKELDKVLAGAYPTPAKRAPKAAPAVK